MTLSLARSASVRLNVFAFDTSARALDESTGHEPTSRHLMKRISRA